jgi:hypothetical protein
MPSKKANKHGTACEYHLAETYNVELARSPWHDGRKNGTPWEFKATAHRHADGNPGNFKVYKKYHAKLQRNGGRYGFAVYRKRGTGTQVLKTKAVDAGNLPLLRWHGGGSHRDTQQAKVDIGDVFG